MADIQVTLRIVGLYFNAPVTVPVPAGGNVTVKDVMDAYIAAGNTIDKVGGLAYSVKEDYGQVGTYSSISSISHHYGGKFDYNADGNIVALPAGQTPTPAAPDGPTLVGVLRDPGLYKLEEFAIPGANGVVAWQYYVVAPDGDVKSTTPVSRGINRFDDPKAGYTIQTGDTIIWRMVAILLGPSVQGKQPRYKAVADPGQTTTEKPLPYTTA